MIKCCKWSIYFVQLIYSFEASNKSENGEIVRSKTIYFGLDDIDLYNRNCDGEYDQNGDRETSV